MLVRNVHILDASSCVENSKTKPTFLWTGTLKRPNIVDGCLKQCSWSENVFLMLPKFLMLIGRGSIGSWGGPSRLRVCQGRRDHRPCEKSNKRVEKRELCHNPIFVAVMHVKH